MSNLTLFFYVFLSITVIFLAIYIIHLIGIETLQRDYERDLNRLKILIKDYPSNYWNPYFIIGCFNTINKYKCRDKEEISVLEAEFKHKYNIKNDINDEYNKMCK